jgi:thiamine-phosphate pyrophosphorylase
MPTSHTTPRSAPKLVLVTDRHATDGRDLVEVVGRALDAGLPAVQLRDKDLDGRTLWTMAEQLRAATARAGAHFFVNDRVDIAVAVGADGLHLGGTSLPVDVARGLLPRGTMVGASTHTLDEVEATTADLVFFGPVYETPSKRPYGPPQGTTRLAEAVRAARVPLLAIGGIDAARVAALRPTGIAGVAVIRAILAAPDPGAATRTFLAALA